MTDGPRRYAALPYAVLGGLVALGLTFLAFVAPLTYDEAFNRTHYAEFGVFKTLVTYDYPNNHIPFTALVVALPRSLVNWDPWSIRIPSIVFGLAMVAIMLVVAHWRRAMPLVPILIVVGSPSLVAYSFLARGYTFSAVWLAVGALITTRLPGRDLYSRLWGASIAGVVLAVGTWPVLTSVFAIPGWIAALVLIVDWWTALTGTVAYAIALGLMVEPIAKDVRSAEKFAWNGNEHFWPWLHDAVSVSNVLWPTFMAVLVVVAISILGRHPRRPTLAALRGVAGTERLALITGGMAVSWYLLTGLAYATGRYQLPFARSSLPALWLVALTIVAVFPRRTLGWVVVALLVPGFVVSTLSWYRAGAEQRWDRIHDLADLNVLDGGTPASVRSVAKTGATEITCTWYSEAGCDLVAPRLESEGVQVLAKGPQQPWIAQCVTGSYHPPYAWQVTVLKDSQPIGVACY